MDHAFVPHKPDNHRVNKDNRHVEQDKLSHKSPKVKNKGNR